MSETCTEYYVDYFRDPQTGGIVHGGDGKPLWTTRKISTQQRADLPAARSGVAPIAGELLVCKRCHLPRRGESGRLIVTIDQHDLVFVPEQYCTCEDEEQ